MNPKLFGAVVLAGLAGGPLAACRSELLPAPDLAVPADLPVVCSHGGVDYQVGEQYQPDSCNTCVCLASGDFACTNKVCQVDAGEGID